MYRIILSILSVLACLKWGKWKNWKEYYPTILYYIIGDLSYNILFYNKSLWEYSKLINHTFSIFFNAFFIAPSIIILFLTYLPGKLINNVWYILCWSCLMTFIEYLSSILGFIIYYNGWSIFWSLGFYCIGFSMLELHYKKPLPTWIISLGFAMIMLFVFHVQLDTIK